MNVSMTGPPKGVVALAVTSIVGGAATGRQSVIIICTKYIPNDKQTIHTRVGTVELHDHPIDWGVLPQHRRGLSWN